MTAEDREAIALVEGFALKWPKLAGRLIHIKNERGSAAVKKGPAIGQALKQRRMGVRKSVSDYFLAVPVGGQPGLWLELKAPDGVLKRGQADFLVEMAMAGYCAAVAWGAIPALLAIELYLNTQVYQHREGHVLGLTEAFAGYLYELTLQGRLRKVSRSGSKTGQVVSLSTWISKKKCPNGESEGDSRTAKPKKNGEIS